MARNNDFTPEELIDNFGQLSGKFQNIVFYHRKGICYYRAAPRPYSKPPTEAQIAGRERFKQAVAFAKSAIADPAQKSALQQRAKNYRSAYQQALWEYLNP